MTLDLNSRPEFPFVQTMSRAHDIPCDVCGKPCAQTLIAASNDSKIRLCSSCMRLLKTEIATDDRVARMENDDD